MIRRAAVAAVAVVLIGPGGSPADAFFSATWRSTVRVEGASPGAVFESARVWLKEGRIRVETVEKGRTSVALDAGGELYLWTEGEKTGLRLSPAAQAMSGRPSQGYARRAEEIRARGKAVGVEAVDGHPCDVVEDEAVGDEKGTYWLARDLRGFPVQARLERRLSVALPFGSARERRKTVLLVHNSEIRVDVPVPSPLLALPADVKFQDPSEVLTGRPRPVPR